MSRSGLAIFGECRAVEKSMLTSRIMAVPGTLAPNRNRHLRRAARDDHRAGQLSPWSVASNGRCGAARLKTRAISVTRQPNRFPVRR